MYRSKCFCSRKPLLEPGTLGPKGHVQVISPYQTETYGSQADPDEETEIPFCTLRMFPEEVCSPASPWFLSVNAHLDRPLRRMGAGSL